MSARPADLEVAAEFFELFKTPWERVSPSQKYSVVLSVDGGTENFDAELVLLYGSTPVAFDRHASVSVHSVAGPAEITWADSRFPVYRRLSVFDGHVDRDSLKPGERAAVYRHQTAQQIVWRIGYDLFEEVRFLLTQGQPPSNAHLPTLELHIGLLRDILVKSGVSFVEILPRPAGYEFICCLTHDVDFFGLRRHGFERTLGGFVARGSLGTLVDVARQRRTLGEAVQNWLAVASLPLIFLGLVRDPWDPFADYARVEDGKRSTFFLVPFRKRPGVSPDGTTDSRRAVAYDVTEIREEVTQTAARGNEIAVHGIDAWRDSAAGQAEMFRVVSVTGQKTAGIRMHWLHFAEESPTRLEQAGFQYDSTCGYNDAVGFRAGTSQVFRLSGTEKLLELPLLIMDSALLFPGRMGLSQEDAIDRCRRLVAQVRRFGGTLVINWHDRSLAPERLWRRSYEALLNEVDTGGRAWFATAGEAVDWYRWRRSIGFTTNPGITQLTVTAPAAGPSQPGATMALHRPGAEIEFRQVDAQTAQTLVM